MRKSILLIMLLSLSTLSIGQPNWTITPADFSFDGSVTAKVIIDGTAVSTGILAAFVGEECRGIQDAPLFFPPAGHYVFIITCYSNEATGETLTFKYYDPVLDQICELNETLEFVPDMIIGSAVNPFLLNCSTLAIELSQFSLSSVNQTNVLLEWKVEVERNISHFEIERSFDGVTWDNMGKVNVEMDLERAGRYQYLDQNVINAPGFRENVYYRLKITENDANVSYSDFEVLQLDLVTSVGTSPNPSNGLFKLRFESHDKDLGVLQVINNNGQVLLQKMIEIEEGMNESTVDCKNLPAGSYYIKISSKKNSFNQRVILEK